jgi:WD40 repeat protein
MTAYDLSLTKNNTMTQNLLNNSLYERATSFLSNHKDDINVMVEMSNLMFASAGNDKRIFIWEKDKQSKKYKLFQEITKELKNMSLKNPILNMIYLYDKRLVSNDSSAIYIWYINPSKLNNPTGFYSIQQKINSTNGNITSLYQIREGYLIFGTKNSNLEIWKEVEGKYQLMQNMSLKIGEISSINQIKDNRVIVASSKGLMKIIELKTNSETKKVEYQLSEFIKSIQGLPINCIECFEDGSFVLGQKTTLHVWKNNESI